MGQFEIGPRATPDRLYPEPMKTFAFKVTGTGRQDLFIVCAADHTEAVAALPTSADERTTESFGEVGSGFAEFGDLLEGQVFALAQLHR